LSKSLKNSSPSIENHPNNSVKAGEPALKAEENTVNKGEKKKSSISPHSRRLFLNYLPLTIITTTILLVAIITLRGRRVVLNIQKRLGGIENRPSIEDKLSNRLIDIEDKLSNRLIDIEDKLSNRLIGIEAKFPNIENNFDIGDRLINIEARIYSIENNPSQKIPEKINQKVDLQTGVSKIPGQPLCSTLNHKRRPYMSLKHITLVLPTCNR